MNTKIIAAAAAAFVALTSVASASEGFFTDSQRDIQLKQQSERVASNGGVVTTPAIDPAYSERDQRLQAQAQGDGAALLTTHGAAKVYVTPVSPVFYTGS